MIGTLAVSGCRPCGGWVNLIVTFGTAVMDLNVY